MMLLALIAAILAFAGLGAWMGARDRDRYERAYRDFQRGKR